MPTSASLRELLDVVAGGGARTGPLSEVLAEAGYGEVPPDLLVEAVSSYADSAPLEVAESLSPFVVHHSPAAVDAPEWGDGGGAVLDLDDPEAALELLTGAAPTVGPDDADVGGGPDDAPDLDRELLELASEPDVAGSAEAAMAPEPEEAGLPGGTDAGSAEDAPGFGVGTGSGPGDPAVDAFDAEIDHLLDELDRLVGGADGSSLDGGVAGLEDLDAAVPAEEPMGDGLTPAAGVPADDAADGSGELEDPDDLDALE